MKHFRFILIALFTICCFLPQSSEAKTKQAKYVFYFIGDGMGVNQVNGTQMYLSEKEGKRGIVPLLFTQFPVSSMVNTYAASNSVTCSAAAGTAMASGFKTSGGTIGMDADHKNSLESIAEKAKKAGKKVGIATNVSIDHATPATFYAHQSTRKKTYEIGTDLAKSGFDFFAGSGFIKLTDKNNPKAPNLITLIGDAGYTFAKGYDDFNAKSASSSKIILMPKDETHPISMPYAIDYQENDLTLPQIAECAINFLSKNSPKGFFLMLEGGKIDWACHASDGGTVFRDVIDFDKAIKVAYDFYLKHADETLLIVTADHETGGIILGGTPEYQTNFVKLANQRCSLEALTAKMQKLKREKDYKVTWEEVCELLKTNLGFWDTVQLTPEQEQLLKEEYNRSFVKRNIEMSQSLYAFDEPIGALAIKILNKIALLQWGSRNHTAGYV
ncbi:MAG: alkaline phosphatase, partial [Bacteroidaceae bacterium]